MTGRCWLSFFTLTFDSSPIKGEGDSVGWCWLVHPRHTPPLWIADQVRNDVTVLVGVGLFSPSPLIPLPSRERGFCRLVLAIRFPMGSLSILRLFARTSRRGILVQVGCIRLRLGLRRSIL